MKNNTEKIGICPYCGWKSKVDFDKNAELVGENTIVIYCDSCEEEYVLDVDMKLGGYSNKHIKEDWK